LAKTTRLRSIWPDIEAREGISEREVFPGKSENIPDVVPGPGTAIFPMAMVILMDTGRRRAGVT